MVVLSKKLAVIVNGDTEKRHLQNVVMIADRLKEMKYEVFVANPKPVQGVAPDHHVQPTIGGLKQLSEVMQGKANSNTDLVIATTGHGIQYNDTVHLVLKDGSDYNTVSAILDGIPYGQRMVYMDQCYSGSWNSLFLNDPKTLFVSGGSKNESDMCQEFTPWFWGKTVPDYNQDGQINWQERYAAAIPHVLFSSAQFIPSPGYRLPGKAPFPNSVQVFHDQAALNSFQSTLRSGQYAVIEFSMTDCKPCQDYAPTFNQLAKNGGGQQLWLRTENVDIAKAWGISEFPSVVIVNTGGEQMRIPTELRKDIPAVLAQFSLSLERRLQIRMDRAERINNDDDLFELIKDVVEQLEKSNLNHGAEKYSKQLVELADKMGDPSSRLTAHKNIAGAMIENGLVEEAYKLYDGCLAGSSRIKSRVARIRLRAFTALELSDYHRWFDFDRWVQAALVFADTYSDAKEMRREPEEYSMAFGYLAFSMAHVGGLLDLAGYTFNQAVQSAGKIRGRKKRMDVLEELSLFRSITQLEKVTPDPKIK